MSETYETFQEYADRYWRRVRATPEFLWRAAGFRWSRIPLAEERVQACSAHAAPQGERGADTPSQSRPSPRHLTAWQRTCRREWERLKGEAHGLRR
jgi:hypothetical protein